MLVKFINENNIKFANRKNILMFENKQVINPRDEDFIEAGYKILEIKKEPIYNPDTEYLIPIYEEQGNIIIQNWIISEYEEELNYENYKTKQIATDEVYDEAIDVEDSIYTYEETNIPIAEENVESEEE